MKSFTLLLLLLLYLSYPSFAQGEESTSQIIIRFFYEMEPAQTQVSIQEGELDTVSIFKYDPREVLETELTKHGFVVISDDSLIPNATLNVAHIERMSILREGSPAKTVINHLGAELVDSEGLTVLKLSTSSTLLQNGHSTVGTFALRLADEMAQHFGFPSKIDWMLQESETQKNLSSIHFNDSQNGWIVGDNGTILRTSDGGITWVLQPQKVSRIVNTSTGPKRVSGSDIRNLSGIQFANSQIGWIISTTNALIRRTNNGGQTWHYTKDRPTTYLTPPPRSRKSLVAMHFINETTGWVVGGFGAILKTTDGGDTWEIQRPSSTKPSGRSYYRSKIHFLNENFGWTVGGPSDTVLITSDGGQTWLAANLLSDISDVHFINENEGWAVGAKGTIARTSNGGESWIQKQSGTDIYLSSVFFIDAKNGWVLGGAGTILNTLNGGDTWERQESGIKEYLSDACFIDTKSGWVIGNRGTILKLQKNQHD